jgi:putative membrane protein
MEGPQDLKFTEMPKIKEAGLVKIIIIFHAVGLAGLSLTISRPVFLLLMPWHLLLMFIVIIMSHKPLNGHFLLFVLLTGIAGFVVEWIGVHKTWMFGNYSYGDTLGLKLDDIPLIMGVNWFLLVYSAGVLIQRSRVKRKMARIICGALLLVLLDVLIEPVALKLGYWQWTGGNAPFKNYVCWFLVSGIMLFVFEQFKFKQQSIVAPGLLGMQFLFFGCLLLRLY